MLYWTTSVPPRSTYAISAACAARSRSLVLKARTPTTIASKRASAGAPPGERLVGQQRDVVADAAQAGRHLVARAGEVADRRVPPVASASGHQPHLRVDEHRLDRDVGVLDAHHAARRGAAPPASRRRSASAPGAPAPHRRLRPGGGRTWNVEARLAALAAPSANGADAGSTAQPARRLGTQRARWLRRRARGQLDGDRCGASPGNISSGASGRTDTAGVTSSGR